MLRLEDLDFEDFKDFGNNDNKLRSDKLIPFPSASMIPSLSAIEDKYDNYDLTDYILKALIDVCDNRVILDHIIDRSDQIIEEFTKIQNAECAAILDQSPKERKDAVRGTVKKDSNDELAHTPRGILKNSTETKVQRNIKKDNSKNVKFDLSDQLINDKETGSNLDLSFSSHADKDPTLDKNTQKLIRCLKILNYIDAL